MKTWSGGARIYLQYLLVVGVAVIRLAVNHPYQFVPIFSCLILFSGYSIKA